MEKNKLSWNLGAESYSSKYHTDELIAGILESPQSVFHEVTWQLLNELIPDFNGKKICVPSSGDNHAVFAFAKLGAHVTSCDIAENQLKYAAQVAKKYQLDHAIEFVCQDTMLLESINDSHYDLVFTSNGVHVWINDLDRMYHNINRILKTDGIYMMHEIHPFQRPLDDEANVRKPYDDIGPYDDGKEITHHWRVMDFLNAISRTDLSIEHTEEMFCEKDYADPFWMSLEDILNGQTATKEEVDRMHDWQHNPMAAIPNWIDIIARKR